MRPKQVFLQCPESPGKLVPHPVHSFPVKSTFSNQEFTFGAVQCQPGGWDTEERETLSIFSSFHSFLLHSVTEFSYLDV